MKKHTLSEIGFNNDSFVIYGYHPPMKGLYLNETLSEKRYLNNKEYFDTHFEVVFDKDKGKYFTYEAIRNPDGTIKDFRTAKHFKEQVDCGFDFLYLQSNSCCFAGEHFPWSELRQVLDEAQKGGFTKAVVYDIRLHTLSGSVKPLCGEGCRFSDFNALVEYCKECIAPYKNHPIFHGVYLQDEPTWKTLPQVCEMYRAIKTAYPDVFVQVNLLPMSGDAEAVTGQPRSRADLFVDVSLEENKNITVAQAYRKYLETYVNLSGAPEITFDTYPIREEGLYEDYGDYDDIEKYTSGKVPKLDFGYFIMPTHFPTIQTVAEVCKKYGTVMGGLSNSCEMVKVRDDFGNKLLSCYKAPVEADMRYQLNAYLCFGVKIFAYYIYWARRDDDAGCYHPNGTTFVSRDGTKTELYYFMQKIHDEMRAQEKIFTAFDYVGMTWLGDSDLKYLCSCKKDELEGVEGATLVRGEAAIITHLKAQDGRSMYCVYNPTPPKINASSDISVTVRFGSSIKTLKEVCGTELKDIRVEGELAVDVGYGGARFFITE